MNHVNTTLPATFRETYQAVSRRLEDLLNDKAGDNPHEDLIDIESILDRLPLATDEYGLAQNRIRNARRYYQAREVGAARYEVRLLMCSQRPGCSVRSVERQLNLIRKIWTSDQSS